LSSLAEALGYSPGSCLLIITCDGLGFCHAANAGVYSAIREGMGHEAGLVVPGPWAREAAARYRGEDVGVHLTLNAELDLLRWGPITYCPSLLDGDGGFPRTVEDLWDHADTEEVRRECRAQIERAIYWGFDVTHLSCHLGAMESRPEFFDVALEMAVEFGLPLRLPDATDEARLGFPIRNLAAEENVLSPDHLIRVSGGRSSAAALDHLLSGLQPGVTEVVLRPAIDTAELRAIDPDWAARVADHDLAMTSDSLRVLCTRPGVAVIRYRQLRDLQRQQTAAAAT
jgi:chitin disaccharide deacetylase